LIVHDERNPKAIALLEGLRARLGPEWSPPADLGIAIGGDGFLLRTVASHGTGCVWLGLNAGYLGFLLNDVDDIDTVAEAIDQARFVVHSFPLVRADITRADGVEVTERAINDVYLERMTGQTARLRLKIDGHIIVDPLVADGLIFATALGSTAYAFSAGGEPLHPLLQVLQVTPIAPHKPRLPSLALPASARAEVEVLQQEWRPVRAVVDGRDVDNVARVAVRLEQDGVRLAYLEPHDFTAQMLRKIIHPEP
jgi:NAD+ kinase